jgi:hypothetical protein
VGDVARAPARLEAPLVVGADPDVERGLDLGGAAGAAAAAVAGHRVIMSSARGIRHSIDMRLLCALLLAPLACASQPAGGQPAPAPPPPPRPGPVAASPDAAPPDAAPPDAAPLAVTTDEAEALLWVDAAAADEQARAACRAAADTTAQVRCLLGVRYAADAKAAALALALYDETGDVAGLLPEQDFDGGYRGVVHLVPELPVGTYRKHLQWIVAGLRDHHDFFTRLGAGGARLRYRWHPLSLQFFRSEKKRTPSAFAIDWTVSYNVNGSINYSADYVRETLFHEVFHLNDADHGGWSQNLAPIFDAIVEKCGTSDRCLAPYSPGDTKVKGGTYYAFQPGNGVVEYAAELGQRYYQEHRQILRKEKARRPAFKCGPPENARAWQLLVDEFFGGVDLVPPCPK